MYKKHPYYSDYSADENGSVIGARGKFLKPILHHSGYNVLTIDKKQFRWHRFVWECHNGLITNKELVINHIDGNKTNNRLENLELVSQSKNARHAFDLGLRSSLFGEDSPTSKLTENECMALIFLSKENYSNKELGEFFGLHPNYVSLIRRKKRWCNLWKKIDE